MLSMLESVYGPPPETPHSHVYCSYDSRVEGVAVISLNHITYTPPASCQPHKFTAAHDFNSQVLDFHVDAPPHERGVQDLFCPFTIDGLYNSGDFRREEAGVQVCYLFHALFRCAG